MKRLLFAFAVAALLLPAAQLSKGADVSFNFFYDNLSGGSWIQVSDYGYCWQPDVAVSDTAWRPYSDGYWTYTDLGWTWVSYEDFGWATYHYGRWARLADHGWVWVPGRDSDLEWAPAWVSWRTGGDYIGWAPLPPETIGVVYEGRPVHGHVDVEFGIGPGWYNFVDVRYIGAPVLRERIVSVNQNVTYINQTVNVTNITYNNNTVYNYGPDYNAVNARAAQPVQRLKLERQDNVDVAAAAKSGALLKPQGDKLVVAAPMKITKPTQTITPPNVKTTVAKANVDKGWGMVTDPKVKSELQQKMKTEDAKQAQIGAGAGQPTGAAAAAGNANVNANANANAGASASVPPLGRGKGKNNKNLPAQTSVNAAANASANATPSPGASSSVPATWRGKGKNAAQTNLPPQNNVETSGNPNIGPSQPPADVTGRGKGKHNDAAGSGVGQFKQNPHAEFGAPPSSVPPTDSVPPGGKNKGNKNTGAQTTHDSANGNWSNKTNVEQSAGTGLSGHGEGKKLHGPNDSVGNLPNAGGASNIPNPGNGRHKPDHFKPGPVGPQGGATSNPALQPHGEGKGKPDKGKPGASPTP